MKYLHFLYTVPIVKKLRDLRFYYVSLEQNPAFILFFAEEKVNFFLKNLCFPVKI